MSTPDEDARAFLDRIGPDRVAELVAVLNKIARYIDERADAEEQS